MSLGLTATQTVDRAGGGLSVAVLSLIENARRDSYTVRTLLALARALDWPDDAISRILAGRPPDEDLVERDTRSLEDRLAELEDQLRALREELAAEREQTQPQERQ